VGKQGGDGDLKGGYAPHFVHRSATAASTEAATATATAANLLLWHTDTQKHDGGKNNMSSAYN